MHVALNAFSLRPAPPATTHQSTHSYYTRGSVAVCVRREWERKGKKKGVELQHSVLFISTVSHGTLEKWNVCSSGWLQHWLRFDWSWMLRTEHITELKGDPSQKTDWFFGCCWVFSFFQFTVFRHARSFIFSKNLKEKCCMWNVFSVNLLGNKAK